MKAIWLLLILLALCVISVGILGPSKPYVLPKKIWTHWHTSELPPYIEKNIAKWRRLHPDWEVNLVTTETFFQSLSLSEIPPGFGDLEKQHQADWIRLKLLKRYGGCWMDSGILLNLSIDSLYREAVSKKADLLLFNIDNLQSNPEFPVGENWFIMAPLGSQFISYWLEEFETAIRKGFLVYKKELLSQEVDLQRIMNSETDVYLTMHACFQKVLQKRLPSANIVYHDAKDSMFKIQSDCDWDKECTNALFQDVHACKKLPYIKLRGIDREGIDILPLID